MHKPGPTEKHAAINVDALPTCIYPRTVDPAGWAAEYGTDRSMTMYQLSPTEDAQKATGKIFPRDRGQERSTAGEIIQHFFPS